VRGGVDEDCAGWGGNRWCGEQGVHKERTSLVIVPFAKSLPMKVMSGAADFASFLTVLAAYFETSMHRSRKTKWLKRG